MDEVEEALAIHRRILKTALWRERGCMVGIDDMASQLTSGASGVPLCVYCNAPINSMHDCAMHEWLIRRGALPVKRQYLIMTKYNCVLAHYTCHEDHETTRDFKLRAAFAQYLLYGRNKIEQWVNSLGLKFTVEIPTLEEVIEFADL